jgi:hypothetical protein
MGINHANQKKIKTPPPRGVWSFIIELYKEYYKAVNIIL